MFFVRMSYGSWKGKCPGTKDCPHIYVRTSRSQSTFICVLIVLHALAGATLSGSLSAPCSCSRLHVLRTSHYACLTPWLCHHTCRKRPRMDGPCCVSALGLNCLLWLLVLIMRLSSVLGLPRSAAFAEYCRPWLAVPLLCSPVPLSQSNCHLRAQGLLQTLLLSGLRAPWRVGMCLPQAHTGPSTEHGSESAPKKYWANESH